MDAAAFGPTERRILLIGITGAGKSSFGNMLLGMRKFTTGAGIEAVTKECVFERSTTNDKALLIYDTPAKELSYNIQPSAVLLNTASILSKSLLEIVPGFHCIALIIRCGRFTSEDMVIF